MAFSEAFDRDVAPETPETPLSSGPETLLSSAKPPSPKYSWRQTALVVTLCVAIVGGALAYRQYALSNPEGLHPGDKKGGKTGGEKKGDKPPSPPDRRVDPLPGGGAAIADLSPGGGNAKGDPLPGGGAAIANLSPGGGTAKGDPLPGGGAAIADLSPGGGNAKGDPLPGGGAVIADLSPGGGNAKGDSLPGGGSAKAVPKPAKAPTAPPVAKPPRPPPVVEPPPLNAEEQRILARAENALKARQYKEAEVFARRSLTSLERNGAGWARAYAMIAEVACAQRDLSKYNTAMASVPASWSPSVRAACKRLGFEP
jgi:hypothetical protein